LGEPDGLLQKYSPEGDHISAPRADDSELGNSPGLRVEDCSKLGDSPGLRVGGCSALGDSLSLEECSGLEGLPSLRVRDCSALGDLPEEHLASSVGYSECPLEEPLGFVEE